MFPDRFYYAHMGHYLSQWSVGISGWHARDNPDNPGNPGNRWIPKKIHIAEGKMTRCKKKNQNKPASCAFSCLIPFQPRNYVKQMTYYRSWIKLDTFIFSTEIIFRIPLAYPTIPTTTSWISDETNMPAVLIHKTPRLVRMNDGQKVFLKQVLMGFNGIFMGFNGKLLGFLWDLMGFYMEFPTFPHHFPISFAPLVLWRVKNPSFAPSDLLGSAIVDVDLAGGAPERLRGIQWPVHQVTSSGVALHDSWLWKTKVWKYMLWKSEPSFFRNFKWYGWYDDICQSLWIC